MPDDVPIVPIPPDALRDGVIWLPRLLVAFGLAGSNGEARRKLAEGAVRIDGEPVADPDADLSVDDLTGRILQIGRRRFVRIGAPADGT